MNPFCDSFTIFPGIFFSKIFHEFLHNRLRKFLHKIIQGFFKKLIQGFILTFLEEILLQCFRFCFFLSVKSSFRSFSGILPDIYPVFISEILLRIHLEISLAISSKGYPRFPTGIRISLWIASGISSDFFKDFIGYSRRKIYPKMSSFLQTVLYDIFQCFQQQCLTETFAGFSPSTPIKIWHSFGNTFRNFPRFFF